MSDSWILEINGAEVPLNEEEVGILNSLDNQKCWDLFDLISKRYYPGPKDNSPNTLAEIGFQHLKNILSAEEVHQLKSEWEEKFQPIQIVRDSEKNEVLSGTDKQAYSVTAYAMHPESVSLVSNVIIKVLNSDFTQYLEQYFQSYFSISHVLFTEALPDNEPITSFRWHMDVGPNQQTHVMIYLDGTEETGGRTEFLNYKDSRKVDEAGYKSNQLKDRKMDIFDIISNANIVAPEPEAGDILVFNATRVYHKGIHPNRKSRKVMFLILKPDARPWYQTVSEEPIFGDPCGRDLYSLNPFYPYFKEA